MSVPSSASTCPPSHFFSQKLPSAIVQISFHSPSPPHAPPLNLFHSALGVATFIGRLFHVGLVSASFVLLCLHILVDNLSVIEELSAIHAIISHANESLYKRVRMRDFLDILDKKVAKMSPTSSVTFQADVSHDIACHVQVRFPNVSRSYQLLIPFCAEHQGHHSAVGQHR